VSSLNESGVLLVFLFLLHFPLVCHYLAPGVFNIFEGVNPRVPAKNDRQHSEPHELGVVAGEGVVSVNNVEREVVEIHGGDVLNVAIGNVLATEVDSR